MSEIHNFTSALPAGDATPYQFLTFGDHGVSEDPDHQSPGADGTANNIIKEMEQHNPRLVFHHGDISYAVGYVSVFNTSLEMYINYHFWTSSVESGFYVISLVCPSVFLSVHQSSVTCHY